MQKHENVPCAQIRFDPKRRQLLLVDSEGRPVSSSEREAYIDRMSPQELRALVSSLFELPIS